MDCYDATIGFADACEGQTATKGKLIAILVIFDVLLTWCCWTELKYQRSQVLSAKYEVVGRVVQSSRHGNRELIRVRYQFRDPQTGQPRQNTVQVPPALAPQGPTAMIQYLPGEYPTSRLMSQARPAVVTVFGVINGGLVAIGAGLIAWLALEARRKLPRGVRSTTPHRRRVEIT